MKIKERQAVKISVNGNLYEVEVQDGSATPMTVLVNGRSYQVEIESRELEIVAAPAPKHEAPRPVTAAPVPAPVKTAVPAPAPLADGGTVRAPMPGTILEILVKAGDKVKYGQALCQLEAMKMKNAIRANREGVITAVHVSIGETVAYNSPLFTLE